jgi:NADH dehydrogenase
VILLEASDHLLDPYPERLRKAAGKQLESLGVEVITGATVESAAHDHIRLHDGRTIPTYTVVWAAGVKASPVAEMLNVPLQRHGRIPIEPTTQVVGRGGVYAVGDIAYLEDPQGQPYPMLIPVANQQGTLAARNILRRINGEPQQPFKYNDRGIMATIGRSRAVAWIYYRIQLTGFLAWIGWLFLHLIMLMGFRNRLSTFLNWVWNYITYDRSVRIILEQTTRPQSQELEKESQQENV